MSRPLEQLPSTTDSVRSEVSGLGADLAPSKQEKDAVKSFIADVTRDVKSLVAQEVELAKAEITAELSKIAMDIARRSPTVIRAAE